MFFSSEMLSKRGPLAKVWLAAHVERKVSKAQTLQTSIPSTVTVILEPASTMSSAPPLALRLSGQLLLGIARIYGKQAKYLLEDCSEASDKIRAAFRSDTLQSITEDPAGEDLLLPAQPNPAVRDAINLRTAANRNLFDFELEFGEGFGYGFGDGWEDLTQPAGVNDMLPILGPSRSRIDADVGEITLPDHQPFMLDEDRPEHGLDELNHEDIQMGDTDGLELGLDVGTEGYESEVRQHLAHDASFALDEGQAADETMEIEVGRDAPGTADRRSARDSLLPDQLGDLSVDKSYDFTSRMEDTSFGIEGREPAFEPVGMDLGEGIDLGLGPMATPGPDPGVQDTTLEDNLQAPPAGGQMTPRATSPAPNPMLDPVDVTPRTSRRLAPHITSPAEGSEGGDQPPPKKKVKHQQIDRITELESADHMPSSLGAGANQPSTLDPPKFLPKDRYQLQNYRLMLDPSRHEFLPRIKEVDGERWLMAAPAGLCKELQDLFRFPETANAINSRAKRPRTNDHEEELESEHGRRAPSVANEGGDFSRIDFGDENLDMMDNRGNDSAAIFGEDAGFQLEIDQSQQVDMDQTLCMPDDSMQPNEEPRSEAQQPDPSEPLAPETRMQRIDGESSKLDLFDDSSDSHLQSQAVEPVAELPGTAHRSKWSKNTLKALSVLKTELTDESQVLKFKEVSNKASRRAGAAFFFELLVLGTRDCLKLKQNEPFGEIEVQSQDRLWEVLEQQAI